MGAAEQTLIVLAVMAVLFVTEIIPLAITSLGRCNCPWPYGYYYS